MLFFALCLFLLGELFKLLLLALGKFLIIRVRRIFHRKY